MRHTALVIAATALFAIAATPHASALVHGVAWPADGIAIRSDGTVYQMHIFFTGTNSFLCATTYTVTLKDLTGAVVDQRTFAGYQNQVQGAGQNYVQETFTDSGGSLVPSIQFAYTAQQVNTVNYALVHALNQVIVGTYLGMQFTAVTAAYIFDFDCNP
ncbi:MAG TPA: hypothetical protein VGR28_15195 [Candidatus Thermoplasmatota archaeon]|jgi:hypothetical protein|nr:hypothetical protein [Candidatus Thermoplasmatota archaeon]